MRYTCIDTFSGAGGLSLGLKSAGFDILYSFDIDQKSIETQRCNSKYFNHKAEILDITQFDPDKTLKQLGLKRGELTLFAGGPPCQGFSIQRIGSDEDDRNNLVFVFVEKMVQLLPQFFLIENVPGITGKRGKKILMNALDYAKENGYLIHQRVLNAQDYGVPQRRKRLIVIGEKDTGNSSFQFPAPKKMHKTVRDTIYDLPEPPFDGSDHPEIVHHRRDKLSAINLKRIKALNQGQGMEYLPEHLLADCHKVGASKIGHRNVYGKYSIP
jgi:DNA (cytosine-5)-methyltransferase 1